MLSLSTLLVVSSMVMSQSDATSPSWEHLEVLDPLVGEWVYEGPLKDGLVGLPSGTTVRMQFSFQWILDKAVLRWEWKISSGEKKVAHGIEHLGWNAKDKQIFSVMFAANGDSDTSHWSVENNAFTSHYTGSLADGTLFRGDVILTVVDKTTVIWKAVGHTVGAAAPINTGEYRYRRQ